MNKLSNFPTLKPSCPRSLLHNLFGDVPRHLRVVAWFHGEAGAALCEGADIGRVAEHRGERDLCDESFGIAPVTRLFDHAAAGIEVTHHIAEEVLRYHYFHFHDRFEE